MTTFRQWLLTQQYRPDPVGDLGRDVAGDGCAVACEGTGELSKHIVLEHQPSSGALYALSRALYEYRQWYRGVN